VGSSIMSRRGERGGRSRTSQQKSPPASRHLPHEKILTGWPGRAQNRAPLGKTQRRKPLSYAVRDTMASMRPTIPHGIKNTPPLPCRGTKKNSKGENCHPQGNGVATTWSPKLKVTTPETTNPPGPGGGDWGKSENTPLISRKKTGKKGRKRETGDCPHRSAAEVLGKRKEGVGPIEKNAC